MQITKFSKLGAITPILGLLLLASCTATVPKVETKYIIQSCIEVTQVPVEPRYSFDELTQPSSPQEEASAIVSLYKDYLNARAYSDTLRYLIAPCLGSRE